MIVKTKKRMDAYIFNHLIGVRVIGIGLFSDLENHWSGFKMTLVSIGILEGEVKLFLNF